MNTLPILRFQFYHFLSFGVLESGFLVGALIFIMRGIGKSTPTIKASPSPNIGRKERIFLFAADAALSTAFLSCSLINL